MRLEEQIITLKQAKRLFELGVKHHANFHWVLGVAEIEEQEGETGGNISLETGRAIFLLQEFPNYTQFIKISKFTNEDVEFHWGEGGEERVGLCDPMYAAYTVAELGELLPDRFITSKSNEKYDRQKGAYYVSSQMQAECPRTYAPTEAQARAQMLIHLLENGILKPSLSADESVR